jgi:hypothetical protein
MTEKKKTLLSDNVLTSEDFKFRFQDYFKNPAAKSISKMLNDLKNPIRSNVASSRQVNNWGSLGLIDDNRESVEEWRKYSVVEALWLNIIYELRCFGYTVNQIKLLKANLEKGKDKVNSVMPLLEYCTFLALSTKISMVLLVFNDGSAIPLPYEEYKANIVEHEFPNHIRIDLNEILQRFFPDHNVRPQYPLEMSLSYEEAELLSFIRMGNYEKVEIRYKNKKIELIEAVERMDTSQRITDILREQKYQSIEVIKKNDIIVSVIRKVKKKISTT